MGWVTRAMIKILTISLGISPYLAVGICFVITVAYSVAAGLWAVLWTDLIQFVIKMSAVIVLADLRGQRGRRHGCADRRASRSTSAARPPRCRCCP